MNLIYIAGYDAKRDPGVYKKLRNQAEAFNESGIRTRLMKLRLTEQMLFGRFNATRKHWEELKLPENTDGLYIRYQKSDLGFIRFLRKFKASGKGRKVVVEIPTYPYKGEDRPEDILITGKDLIFRALMKRYVDRIATFSADDSLFGIPALRISNGLNFQKMPVRRVPDLPPGQIHMIGVSSVKYWHGYDRVIAGLEKYYKQGGDKEVFFHLVGNGPELGRLKSMARAAGMTDRVLFHGALDGEALDKVYDMCSLGVSSLGIHRKQIKLTSELKSKEYMAKGLPIITEGEIDTFIGKKLIWNPLVCPDDESPLDIRRVARYYDRVYRESGKTPPQIASEIRRMGEALCDMKAAMAPVIRYFQEGRGTGKRRACK